MQLRDSVIGDERALKQRFHSSGEFLCDLHSV